jgi:catechol 2,3-dioxygenase
MPEHLMEVIMPEEKQFFRPRRLGHANLWVKDLHRSEGFYNSVCGLAVEFTEPDLVAAFLGTGNTPHDLGMIEITGGKARYGRDGLLQIPAGVGSKVGLGHLAWELENEAELVDGYRRAKSAGLPIGRTVDHQVAHSVYMNDPDGNSVEFYCDTIKDWRSVLHGEMDLITGAWDPEAAPPATDPRYDEAPRASVVPDAPIHPVRMTHAVLATRDVSTLADFYRRVVGLKAVCTSTDGSVVCLKGSHPAYSQNIAICEADRAEYHHIAFLLADEDAVVAAEAALRAHGVTPERSVDVASKRSFFLSDPDGFRIEFYALRGASLNAVADAGAELRPYLV